MNSGIVGGLIGVIIGIAGGVIGAYYSIKNSNGPNERKFMIKFSTLIAVLVVVLLGVVFSVGYPAAYWFMVPFFIIVLPAMIYFGNKKQQKNSQRGIKSEVRHNKSFVFGPRVLRTAAQLQRYMQKDLRAQ